MVTDHLHRSALIHITVTNKRQIKTHTVCCSHWLYFITYWVYITWSYIHTCYKTVSHIDGKFIKGLSQRLKYKSWYRTCFYFTISYFSIMIDCDCTVSRISCFMWFSSHLGLPSSQGNNILWKYFSVLCWALTSKIPGVMCHTVHYCGAQCAFLLLYIYQC